ncbi:HDOD domain-containing protein [Desulfogranum japonicum]|uniref:HDOD domain-containing protein n=1 Tax=Desulfogranum japonicum TaxID=231447 RepID=UPI00041FCDF7|nr:HDOD domain-containing protein [Desulfogranum japonicum]
MSSSSKVLQRLSLSKQLPSMPPILLQLIKACRDPALDLAYITSIVNKDAALCAKTLHLSNSAYVGAKRTFTDIGQAVVYLGADTIKNLAITTSIRQIFKGIQTEKQVSIQYFWYHSLFCAVLAEKIAETLSPRQSQDAYLAALLHDIGKLVLWVVFPEKYEQILHGNESCWNPTLRQTEQELLGVDHTEAGSWLCKKWHLPDTIGKAIGQHHHPLPASMPSDTLPGIIAATNLLAHAALPLQTDQLRTVLKFTGLSMDKLGQLHQQTTQNLIEMADAFAIQIPPEPPSDYLGKNNSPQSDERVMAQLAETTQSAASLAGILEELLSCITWQDTLLTVRRALSLLVHQDQVLFVLPTQQPNHYRIVHSESCRQHSAAHIDVFSLHKDKTCIFYKPYTTGKLACISVKEISSQQTDIFLTQIIETLNQPALLVILPLLHLNEIEGFMVMGVHHADHDGVLNQTSILELLARHTALQLNMEKNRRNKQEIILQKQLDSASLFAQKIGHEISNPIGALRNYMQVVLLKEAKGERFQSELNIINDELERVSHLIHKLQNFPKEKEYSELHEVNLNRIIEKIVLLCKASIPPHKNIAITFQPCSNSSPVIATDAAISQILLNLITNAIDAIEQDGKIRITTEHHNNQISVTVSDTGIGIPPETMSNIFMPGVSSKKNNHPGLGLAITKKILLDLNGTIKYNSSKGQTHFTFTLPAAIP